MKILVLYAHPIEESFNAALHRLIIERLTAAGHAVDDLDLYAEDFDPRLSRAERLAYHDGRGPQDPADPYVRRLLAADGMVLSFPVWNYGYPAILKGFFDRVFLPGVSFKLVDGKDGCLSPVGDSAGSDAVLVGRIAQMPEQPDWLTLWVVADNVRKSAAVNTVQIAEILLKPQT